MRVNLNWLINKVPIPRTIRSLFQDTWALRVQINQAIQMANPLPLVRYVDANICTIPQINFSRRDSIPENTSAKVIAAYEEFVQKVLDIAKSNPAETASQIQYEEDSEGEDIERNVDKALVEFNDEVLRKTGGTVESLSPAILADVALDAVGRLDKISTRSRLCIRELCVLREKLISPLSFSLKRQFEHLKHSSKPIDLLTLQATYLHPCCFFRNFNTGITPNLKDGFLVEAAKKLSRQSVQLELTSMDTKVITKPTRVGATLWLVKRDELDPFIRQKVDKVLYGMGEDLSDFVLAA